MYLFSDKTIIVAFNWDNSEPNKFEENCLAIYGDNGRWNDNSCDDKLFTFCQGGK